MTQKRVKGKKGDRDVFDPDDRWWSVDDCADYLGITRASILRYIRDGLPLHFPKQGGYIDRDELLKEVQARRIRRQKSLGK